MYHLIAINVNLVLCTTKRLEEKYQLIPNYWELNVSFNCHKWNSAFFRICTLNKCIFIQIYCISNTDFLYFNTDFCCLWRTIEKYQLIPNYWELNVSFNCHKWNSAFFRICTLNKCIFIQIFCISNTDLLYFKYKFSVL